MADNGRSQVRAGSLTGGAWWAVFLFAVLLTVALGAFIAFMILAADDGGTDETTWNRYSLLYGSAQAIVAAAIGWVFGREVYRHTADSAQKNAEEANEQIAAARRQATEAESEMRAIAAQAASDRTRGRALYAAIMASAAGADGPDFRPMNATDDEGVASSRGSQLRSLRALAEQLYGDRVDDATPERVPAAPDPDADPEPLP